MGVTGLRDSLARVLAIYHNFAFTSISCKKRPFSNMILMEAPQMFFLSNGRFVIKCRLLIRISFRLGTDGWNCVTKGKMHLFSLRFCWRACFPSSTSESVLCKKKFWITPIEEFFFEVFSVFFSKSSFEEFVLKSLKASPFTKPLFTPGGWHKVKCVYWKVSVGLKCVRKSSTESFLNLSPLYTVVCKNVVSVSDISAVNLIVAWCLSACSMNLAISSLLTKMLSKNLFQTSGFVSLRLRISVSTLAMKMLAKLQTF